MQIITSSKQLQALTQPCAIALGTFDGLHRGHQDVIRSAVDYAASHRLMPAVFTFSNHPLACINPKVVPPSLLNEKDKQAYLASWGIKILVDLPFDSSLASLTPAEFLKLWPISVLRCLAVGANFTYGCRGCGNTATLTAAGRQHNFTVIVRPLLKQQGMIISSSAVREAITQGNLRTAAQMLGRPYGISGLVVQGLSRGRTLGFPTANLLFDRRKNALPPAGVYAVQVTLPKGQVYRGMCNIGTNPTFGDLKQEVLEIHLLAYQGNLYDQRLQVTFFKFLRSETKFPSAAALQKQLRLDREQVEQTEFVL